MNAYTPALALLLAAAPASAASPTPSRDTVAALRSVGAALMHWLVDHVEKPFGTEEGPTTSVDWSRCQSLSPEHAAELLEHEYIKKLPREDGWGHPLEFCLHQDGSGSAVHAIGVRSAGADGIFESDVYGLGAFDAGNSDRDVVWVDGFFVRWPEATRPAQQ